MTKIAKPTIPGIYPYCEEGRCATVSVYYPKGIIEYLVATPMLPRWEYFSTPVWDLDSLCGAWFSIE